MKYIKFFDSFINDDNRGEGTQYPELNPVIKFNAKEYVDAIMSTNEYLKILKLLKIEEPKDISEEERNAFFDDVHEKAIEYFTKNPEELPGNNI